MTCPYSDEHPGINPYNEYSAVAEHDADLDGDLIGLVITTSGRFGNAMFGCPYGIAIALQLKLRYVRLPDVEGLRLREPVTIGGLTLLPTSGPLPGGGCFLKGPFDNFSYFPRLNKPDSAAYYRYVQDFIRPLLSLPPAPSSRELVIHIRSGDIFSSYVHGHYVQPPLAFYKLVVEDLRMRGMIDSVRVVSEDRLNPCVDALESWLIKSRLPTIMQSSDFDTDLTSIIDSNHFCFGLGSFGPAVCLLSRQISTVHHFQAKAASTGATFECATEINEYVLKIPYIPIGEWDNSDEQRQLMIEFPKDGLARLRVRSSD